MSVHAAVAAAIKAQNGLLFFRPTLVGRISYCGRDILTKNSDPALHGDDRGYVLVERWVVSKTAAGNEKTKEGEGLSVLLLPSLPGQKVLFKDAVVSAEKELVGKREYFDLWPLIKVLDIGGKPVYPSFKDGPGEAEIPPIPCHVHSGYVVNGKMTGPGKLEAYFFPPLENVYPYNRDPARLLMAVQLGRVISRLGFKPETTKAQVLEALKGFGKDDSMYGLMNVYPLHAHEGWTIPTGVVHSPGPWPTIEIQRSQDDFNFFCWQLGCKLHGESREKLRQDLVLRGLADDEDLVNQALDWDKCVSPTFKEDNFRPAQLLEEGGWGRCIRIFWDNFYAEGYELKEGAQWTRKADERPYAVLVWSGRGRANGQMIDIDAADKTEFLVTPHTPLTLVAEPGHPLYLYSFFPLLKP